MEFTIVLTRAVTIDTAFLTNIFAWNNDLYC